MSSNSLLPPRQHKPVSCAECRRLKLRCDRVFPCSSCKKRRCEAICPDGVTLSRKAIRQEYASNMQFEPLITRIRDLEHALATLQATYLTSPHPLLRKDLREMGSASSTSSRPPSPPAEGLDQLSENLGTLSVTGYGRSRFFGLTGSALPQIWHLEEESGDSVQGTVAADPTLTSLALPPEILQLVSAFPFPKPTPLAASIGDWIVSQLPPSMEAWSLCETFFENGAYIFIPLSRASFIEDIFTSFYRPNLKQNADIPRGHRIFAIGEMLDLTKPAMPTGGKPFYYLARAAMSLEPLFHQPTLTAVQVIILMNVYLSMSDHPEGAETVYVRVHHHTQRSIIPTGLVTSKVLAGLNLKLALMLGLHRDSLKFANQVDTNTQSKGLLPRKTEDEMRRAIFHEVVHFEIWMALMTGRPSLLNFDQYDCKPPGFDPERGNVLETHHMKGQAWSYGFIRTCLVPVLNYAVAVKPPPYANVMKLDAVIRAHSIPHHMEISSYEEAGPNSPENTSRAAVMLRFSGLSHKEIALLYLHRPYFACAMTDFSGDPLGCPFTKSVIASFASACTIIAKISLLFELEPALSVRIWLFWHQLFVPSILGTIVVRSTACSLAPKALTELDKLVDLLHKAKDGFQPSKILRYVLKVLGKAHAAYDIYHSTLGLVPPVAFDASAELSALAGKSRVSLAISNKSSPAAQSSVSSPPASQADPVEVAAPVSPAKDQNIFPETDWSSLEDLESFVASCALESQPQQDPVPSQPYDYTPSSNGWVGSDNSLIDQSTNQSYPQDQSPPDQMLYPGLEMQPTWNHFMAQMFGNGF